MGASNAWKDEEALKACDKAVQLLDGALRNPGVPEPGLRLVAASETLLAQLFATRFNIGQYRALREEMARPAENAPPPAGMNGFARPAFADVLKEAAQARALAQAKGLPQEQVLAPKWLLDYRNVWFCHGPDRVADISLLGGTQARKDQLALAERIERNIQKYRGTPWEILNRRIGLVVFRPYVLPPPPPDEIKDAKDTKGKTAKKNKGPEAPKQPLPKPVFKPPTREPRPFRGSTLAAEGAAGVGGGTATDEDKRGPAVTPGRP
jgi:hypothetical protein